MPKTPQHLVDKVKAQSRADAHQMKMLDIARANTAKVYQLVEKSTGRVVKSEATVLDLSSYGRASRAYELRPIN